MVCPVPDRFNPARLAASSEVRGGRDDPHNGSGGQDGSYATTFRLTDCKRLVQLLATDIPGQPADSGEPDVRQLESGSDEPVEADPARSDPPGASCEVTFALKPWGKHVMAVGQLRSSYRLQCQRCLETFDFPVNAQFELVLVPDQDAADRLPESIDPVILAEDGMIHVVDLFEDELILQVPAIPRHASAEECRFDVPVTLLDAEEPEVNGTETEKSGKRANPFAALKDLKFDQ